MKKFAQWVPGTACSFTTTCKSITILVCAVLATLFTATPSIAQSSTNIDVTAMGFEVQVPNVTLAEGQSVEATVTVGANGIVKGALGFAIWLELSSDARITTSLEPTTAGSWIADAATGVTELPSTGNDGVYKYQLERETAASGQGTVFKVHITATRNGVLASRLVARAGGLMQIDNLELRTASSNADLSVWPNPMGISDGDFNLHVQHASASIMSSKVIKLDGQVLATFGALQQLDLSQIPVGTYWLQVTTSAGEVLYRKLMLN